MSTEPTPQQNNPESNNPTSGAPPWYPPEYPEWLVSESCLFVIWGMMSGGTLTRVDETVIAKFRPSTTQIIFDATKLTPCLIHDMALAVNPGATEDCVRLFIRGIVETVVVHQGCDIPKSKRFLCEHPEFQAKANWNNSSDAAEALRTFVGILLASKQTETESEGSSGTES